MKKITKQFICVLLIFTVCLFTACGNDGAKDQSEITDGGITFDPEGLVDWEYTVKTDDLLTYNLIENIDFDSVKPTADGGVSFVAAAPKGGEMRFVGTPGVTVQPGAISFEPDSRIMALDSIGRICKYKPVVSDPGQGENWFAFTGGYTFDGRTSVDSRDELFDVWPSGILAADVYNNKNYEGTPVMHNQPNMIGFGADNVTNTDAFTISELVVYYDETTYATPIGEMQLNPEWYHAYMEGELYDPSKEVFDIEKEIFDFHLLVMPLLADKADTTEYDIDKSYGGYLQCCVQDIAMERITIGELKDADGNVMDKATDGLTMGATLEISLDGGEVFDMPLPIVGQYKGAQTLNQLAPYRNAFSQGNVNVLVIPLVWQDCPELATEELLNDVRTALGRVIDTEGNVTDYSGDKAEGYSFSSYFDAVSNGKYHVDSFITDWCPMNYSFADMQYEWVIDKMGIDEAYQWVKETYPDLDWSRFDTDQDGIADAVIFIGANPEVVDYYMTSFAGAAQYSFGYYPENTQESSDQPALKDFVYIGSGLLDHGNIFVHEYGHSFGLIDYYDVTYSGINAVGGFDMQSDNVGDWNAYSKYSVGWIEPHIVQNLAAGESVEFTIGAQSDTGDAIVIPAAGAEFDGPFGEYMIVDLFTDSGVNEYDAQMYGLADTTGVRIYHVNAAMERRVLKDDYGTEYPIGTVHYTNAYTPDGMYHIELLQKGGDNTFTGPDNLRPQLGPQDLFYAGDSFDAADYGEFLTDGKMDSGDEFGYTIKVTSITETDGKPVATVRVTRK